MAGKGDKWRKNFDYAKYWDNWDKIKKPLESQSPTTIMEGDAKDNKAAEQQPDSTG